MGIKITSVVNGDTIEVVGDDAEEVYTVLEGFVTNADGIYEKLATVKQLGLAKGVFTGTATVNQITPAGNSPQAGPPNQSPPGSPVCAHGPMVWKTGNKNGNSWAGHLCSAPNGTPMDQKCKPVWPAK